MSVTKAGHLRRMCRKTEPCRFYQRGACKRGPACEFAHGERDLQTKPDLQRTKPCPTMANGQRCEDPNCPFAHYAGEFRKFKPELHVVGQEAAESTKNRISPCGLASPDASTDCTGSPSLNLDECTGSFKLSLDGGNADASWNRQTPTCPDSGLGRQTSDSGFSRQVSDRVFSRERPVCCESGQCPKHKWHKTRICSFHLQGKCRKDGCAFAHGAHELNPRAGRGEPGARRPEQAQEGPSLRSSSAPPAASSLPIPPRLASSLGPIRA